MKPRTLAIAIVLGIVALIMSGFAYYQWRAYDYEFEHGIQGPLGHRKMPRKSVQPGTDHNMEYERIGDSSQ